MGAFKHVVPFYTIAISDGKTTVIPVEGAVLGDLVVLCTGSAFLRIFALLRRTLLLLRISLSVVQSNCYEPEPHGNNGPGIFLDCGR
jgi:hypothetical protein